MWLSVSEDGYAKSRIGLEELLKYSLNLANLKSNLMIDLFMKEFIRLPYKLCSESRELRMYN